MLHRVAGLMLATHKSTLFLYSHFYFQLFKIKSHEKISLETNFTNLYHGSHFNHLCLGGNLLCSPYLNERIR